MEEILRKLQKEASGSKYKAIKESCTWALETLDGVDTIVKIPPHLLREKCLLPLQLALESKNVKLAQHALAGIQESKGLQERHVKFCTSQILNASSICGSVSRAIVKLLAEERFVSMETDSDEKQLLNQILNAVKVTPSLHEDLQVEVMKVLLCITYTPTFDLNGSAVLKIAEPRVMCTFSTPKSMSNRKLGFLNVWHMTLAFGHGIIPKPYFNMLKINFLPPLEKDIFRICVF